MENVIYHITFWALLVSISEARDEHRPIVGCWPCGPRNTWGGGWGQSNEHIGINDRRGLNNNYKER